MSKTKYRDTDFLYATGRVRALESKLLTKNDILKMIDARDAEAAYRVPEEKDLGYGFPAEEYEKALNAELHECYDLVDNIVGNDNDFMKVFRYKYDGHNFKTLIKEQMTDRPAPEDMFSDLGNASVEDLRAMLAAEKIDSDKVNETVGEAAIEAKKVLAETGDAQRVDIIIDKAVLVAMANKADRNGYTILVDIVKSMIDIANIRMIVRASRMNKDLGFVRHILSGAGYIPRDTFEKAFSDGMDAITELISKTIYGKHFEPALEQLRNGEPLTQFEKLCDDYNKKKLVDVKLVAFGIEPVVSYVFAKEAEVMAIRIIMASKYANVPAEDIYKRVREVIA